MTSPRDNEPNIDHGFVDLLWTLVGFVILIMAFVFLTLKLDVERKRIDRLEQQPGQCRCVPAPEGSK